MAKAGIMLFCMVRHPFNVEDCASCLHTLSFVLSDCQGTRRGSWEGDIVW